VVIVVAVLAPFSVDEVRQGLYPQIGDGRFVEYTKSSDPSVWFSSPPADDLEEPESARKQVLLAQDEIAESSAGGGPQGEPEPLQQRALASSKAELRYSPKAPPKALQQDPKAVVQTGHGLPSWKWNQWHLDWSGPVNAGHRMRLYLLGPTANLILKILEVLLVVGVTLMVVRRGLLVGGRLHGDSKSSALAAGTTAMLIGLLLPLPALAQDSQPSDDRLAELLDKLTRSTECPQACVSVSNLVVALRGADMTLTSEVHAAARTSFRLPGPASSFAPSRVLVNGKPTSALLLDEEGFIHVRIEQGRHMVEASGSLPNVATLTLELRDRPRLAVAEAPGWTVDGIDSDGHPDGSIQLARVATRQSDEASFEESAYPPFFEVQRDLDLGLPWLVSTTVRRLTPLGTAAVVRVPLLPGESVTESSLQVEGGEVVVAMGRDQDEVTWSSKLRETPSLTLEAVADKPLSEVWNLSCGAIQQCTFEGPPPVQRKDGTRLRSAFRPWPGETLVIQTQKPAGAPGPSMTVDWAQLEISPGARMLTGSLELRIRTSRGGLQKIDLPDKASIKSVTVNGTAQPFSPQQRSLQLTLQTGSQDVTVLWQQDEGLSNMLRVPQVKVEGSVANAKIILNLPQDRWLLWAGGPSWGPAILFWGFLLTILLGSLILGRISSSPLKSWQWMLLGLGLTQVPIGVSVVIVGWFFALEWRARNVQKHFVVHNILQVALGLWTLVAAICLVGSVYSGLAVQPDMQVGGNNSSNSQLIWLVDRAADTLPTPWALSVPLLVWKLIMLAWALWLAWSVVQWAPWAFKRWSHEVIWRPRPKPKHAPDAR
jgi:hypothetical protein